MGLCNNGVPEEYVDTLQKEFGIKCFVETGTFHGATAKWAAERFEQVVTIELQKHYISTPPQLSHRIGTSRFCSRHEETLGANRSYAPTFHRVARRSLFRRHHSGQGR
jgi:hypothetical protein